MVGELDSGKISCHPMRCTLFHAGTRLFRVIVLQFPLRVAPCPVVLQIGVTRECLFQACNEKITVLSEYGAISLGRGVTDSAQLWRTTV